MVQMQQGGGHIRLLHLFCRKTSYNNNILPLTPENEHIMYHIHKNAHLLWEVRIIMHRDVEYQNSTAGACTLPPSASK